ncbi:winged helix-turn-helix domain-containing protein [Pseudoalteromonas phenolica]|uniref:winged helix-turn-helix domain-containing protein n=1 Tax=Pseudoalteromonas phenolica TaxID=161398 RepID=UPI000FFECCB8|nr:winged helix-turn-helix domain-containing protein [Pseudoalteromonas phenolica]RXF00776.1 winged helix family transcriptional regulator [Pseudoalteromonas phenolica O-BC30]
MQTYKTPHWTFYSANNELIYSDGKSIQLAARHNACLLALLEAKGEAVDYDTMLLKVWGTQFRDTNTIASVISELRKQINCGDPSLKYIVTIPKKGYRFNNFEEVETLQESISHPKKNSNRK